jgi:hypothetical protein
MILLIVLCVLLSLLSGYFGYSFYLGKKKNKEYQEALENGQEVLSLALKYEEFFTTTIEDMNQVVETLDSLMKGRQLIANDPDIQNIFRLLVIARNTIVGYINARETTIAKEENQEKEKQF